MWKDFNHVAKFLLEDDVKLLDMSFIDKIDTDSAIILCEWRGEYVVWTYDTFFGERHWGHYFERLDDAVEYFMEKTCDIVE